MSFVSFEFPIFFAVVTILFFKLPPRRRPLMLLAASYIFYMAWEPRYALLLLISTTIDFVLAQRMEKFAPGRGRLPCLIISLAANLGLLFAFKYFNFAAGLVRDSAGFFGREIDPPVLNALLPVGISIYTFQTISYSIDVYRGARSAEKRFIHYALYVSFFPQLVAGPIERSTRLLPQFDQEHHFDYDRVTSGLRLMGWGLFKKCVVADRLAAVVDAVYGSPRAYSGPALAAATVMFTFQIFCDFSGYTDIAIGAARVMGFELMENF